MKQCKKYYKKLVRDLIPEIIKKKDLICKTRVLNKIEFNKQLKEKLIEEAKEVLETLENKLIDELADVLEVIKTLAINNGFSFREIEKQQINKAKKRGGFRKRVMLIWTSNKTES